MAKTTCTITQESLLRGRQTLTLDGDKIKSVWRQGLSLQEYQFELYGFEPYPMRVRRMPIVKTSGIALMATLGVLCLGFGLTAAQGTGKKDDMAGMFTLGGVLLALATVAWLAVAKRIVNAVVFQGLRGHIVLWTNRPSEEEFEKFVAVLTNRIRNAQSCEQRILQQLRRAGIIDDWQYDQAAKLLDHPEGQ